MGVEQSLELTSLPELLVLNRVLTEARFHSGLVGSDIPGSVIAAELHRDVVAALANHHRQHNLASLKSLEAWLVWAHRDHEKAVLIEMFQSWSVWDDWDEAKRREVVSSLVLPFVATDAEIRELVAAV